MGDWRMMGQAQRRRQGAPSNHRAGAAEAKWAINAQASGRGDQVPTEAIMARKSGQQLYDDLRATGPTGRATVTDTGLINGIPAPSPRLRTDSNIVRANARRMMNY